MAINLQAKSREELEAMVAAFLVANKPKALSCKVSEKGAVSVYGFGKWPVTLYRSQWERLFEHQDAIKAFISANSDRLSVKS